MARNINGGTERFTFGGNLPGATNPDLVAVALRFRTTQTTANALLVQRWNPSSRQGFAFIINNTANKLFLAAYGFSTQTLGFGGTATINDGSWKNLIANFSLANGAANEMFVNGSSDGSGNSSNNWFMNAGDPLLLGDSFDAFWPTYVGDVADVGYWHGVHLNADDRAAYEAGIAPRHIKPAYLKVDAPLYRDLVCRRQGAAANVSGTTAVDHPRVFA